MVAAEGYRTLPAIYPTSCLCGAGLGLPIGPDIPWHIHPL